MNERIKLLRRTLKLSQDKFASNLGVSRDVVVNIELARVDIKPRMLDLICRTYNVNPYWLETGSGEMFNAVDDVEKAVSFYMSALKGGTEADDNFKKVFVAELAGVLDALGPAGWQAVKQMIVNVYAAQQGEK